VIIKKVYSHLFEQYALALVLWL